MADQKLQFSKFYFDKLNCTEIGLFLTVAKTIIFGYDYQELNVSTRIADLCESRSECSDLTSSNLVPPIGV